jgi:hypothetical protein
LFTKNRSFPEHVIQLKQWNIGTPLRIGQMSLRYVSIQGWYFKLAKNAMFNTNIGEIVLKGFIVCKSIVFLCAMINNPNRMTCSGNDLFFVNNFVILELDDY